MASLTAPVGVLGTLAVAGAVFGLAFNSGSYGLTARCAIGAAVWWGLALAIASGLLPRSPIPRLAVVAAGFLGALTLLSGLSVIWSPSAETAFGEADRVLLYLGVFLLVALTAKRVGLSRWVDGIGLGIVAIALLALVARLFPHLIPGSDSSPFADDPRATWPLDYWNGLAIFAGLAVPSLLRIAVTSRQVVARGAAVAALPALASIIYLTASRGGAAVGLVAAIAFVALTRQRVDTALALLIGAGGSIAAVAVLAARSDLVDAPQTASAAIGQGHSACILISVACVVAGVAYALVSRRTLNLPRLPRRTVRIAAAVVAVAVVGGIAASDPAARVRSFTASPVQGYSSYTQTHLGSGSSSGRWQFWSAAVDQFRGHPVVGGGAGSYPAFWLKHGSLRYFTRDAHSVYLQTLGELGLVGFILLLGGLVTVIVAAVRRLRARRMDNGELAAIAALALAFLVAVGLDWMWQLPAVALVGVAALALLVGGATDPAARAPAGIVSSRRRWAGRAAFLGVGAAAVVALAVPLLAQSDIERSQAQATRHDFGAALASARAAKRVQPWAASPRLQLGLVHEAAGNLPAAARDLRAATRRDPSDWRLWVLSARIAHERRHDITARADITRAASLNPRSPLIASFRRSLDLPAG